MKKSLLNPLAYLILSLFIFTSCQDEEIDSIFFRTDGGISTVIKDADGQGISDVKVSLYNLRSDNRIDYGFTNQNGIADFGRFEAGEYLISYEFTHNDEFFRINEEVHIISGTDKQHEVIISDHYGELLVRILDNSTGQPVEFDIDAKIGLIPVDEPFLDLSDFETVMDLIKYSYDAEGELLLSDLPEAHYVMVLYNNDNILYNNSSTVDPFEKSYVNFAVNSLSMLLASKSSWVVSNVNADSNAENIIPISRISFGQDERMVVTYENGETDEAYYYMSSSGSFDWYNLGTSNFNFNFNEDFYVINSDGSITFYFSSWATYNYNTASEYYSSNVSITLS